MGMRGGGVRGRIMDRRVAFLGRGCGGGCRIAVQPKLAWGTEVPSGEMCPACGKEKMS